MSDLWQQMRAVLAQLELVSHGTTTHFGPNAGANHETLLPPGDPRPPHLLYRNRFHRCLGDTGRRAVLQDAKAELKRLKHSPTPTEPEWGSYHWKVKVANDDRPIETVARFHGIARSTVSKYRARYRTEKRVA